jgi:hypothetical protein
MVDPNRKREFSLGTDRSQGWTDKEIENLIKGIVGYKKADGWDPIAKMVGRSKLSCRGKWDNIRRNKKGIEISHKVVWTRDMDRNLEKFRAIKYDWKMIAQILDVPDYMECKLRWQRLNMHVPSEDEEAKSGDDGKIGETTSSDD